MRILRILTCLYIAMIGLAASSLADDSATFLKKRAHLLVRNIGHELLLHAGDSTSRVLPVKQFGNAVFQLEFERPFSFMPDTLHAIVQRNLEQNEVSLNYWVNVKPCTTDEVVYGFEVNPVMNLAVPCLGRVQPEGCYKIQIAFNMPAASKKASHPFMPYVIGGLLLSLAAFVGRIFFQKDKQQAPITDEHRLRLGKYLFATDTGMLTSQNETIELSDKETKLLTILASQQNELITRDRLLKEVWEDYGVFTSRSLDVFISKLRKKFKHEPTIKFTNVHGKGYKLEVK